MTRLHLGQRVRRVAPWLGAAMLLLGAVGACNTKWEAVLSSYQFNTMNFVSVFPAHRNAEGNYERQCVPNSDKPVNSLLFSLNLVGTDPSGPNAAESEKELDWSIRPGDLIKMGTSNRFEVVEGKDGSISESHFRVDVPCFETYPDPDLTDAADCQGITGPRDQVPAKLRYVGNFPAGSLRPEPTDRDALALAVLVDQSGSMKGFVEQNTGVEAKNGSSGPWDAANFSDGASDPDSQRLTAIRNLFNSLLNPSDRAGLFKFGEVVGAKPAIVCGDAVGRDGKPILDKDEAARRGRCFNTDRRLTLDSADFAKLSSEAKGRTPLWAAVSDVYDFMKSPVPSRVKQILVIGDGPDTCHDTSPDRRKVLRDLNSRGVYQEFDQTLGCSDVSYEMFLEKLLNDQNDPNLVPVHISFIQFQAVGYRERDPRQQEIACRTGGHYIFVNSQDFLVDGLSKNALGDALGMAVQQIRYALAGTWTLALDVSDLFSGAVSLGSELAVQADISLQPNVFNAAGSLASLRVGYQDATNPDISIPKLDRRGAVRVPCATGVDDCSWYSGLGDCQLATCRAVDNACMVSPVVATSDVCQTTGTCVSGFGACSVRNLLCQDEPMDELGNWTNKAEATPCCDPVGTCFRGECVTISNPCKVMLFDSAGGCGAEINRANDVRCDSANPAKVCKDGACG